MRISALSKAAGVCAALVLGAADAAAEPPRVVTSILPLQSLAANVMQGVGEPEVLVEGVATPHSFALRPSDAAALQDADLVIWVGEGLESFLEAPLASLSGDARMIELLEARGVSVLPTRKEFLWGEGHEKGHDHEEDQNHGHDHNDGDPHVWLDLGNAIATVEAVAGALAQIDPGNAEIYLANAHATSRRLSSLDAEFNRRLEPLIGRRYVVFHDAYHYFEARYGLTPIGAVAVSPERSPGAQHLAEIRERMKAEGVVCVFSEPQFEPKLLEVLTEGTGARGATLDPLGAGLEPGPEAYFTLMENLAANLESCLAP